VDPRLESDDELLLDAAFLVELLDAELVAARSEKRLPDPLAAPRLEAADRPADADPESEPSDWDPLLALFEDVMVMVDALGELEPDDEPLDDDDEPDEEPPPPPNTLAAADMAPRDEPRLPLKLPRLPRNCGAITAAKRSAVITPDTRKVRCTSPAAIIAVRTVVPVGPPPPSFGAKRSRFR
jgi:hypothetical protein